MLSVVAQQILIIQQAKASKVKEFHFEGELGGSVVSAPTVPGFNSRPSGRNFNTQDGTLHMYLRGGTTNIIKKYLYTAMYSTKYIYC